MRSVTEAHTAILAFSFGELALERVMASTCSHNLRASRLLERLGFFGQPESDDSRLLALSKEDWAHGVPDDSLMPTWRVGMPGGGRLVYLHLLWRLGRPPELV